MTEFQVLMNASKPVESTVEKKIKVLFAEVERQNFDDRSIYSILDDLKVAVLNAIRRG